MWEMVSQIDFLIRVCQALSIPFEETSALFDTHMDSCGSLNVRLLRWLSDDKFRMVASVARSLSGAYVGSKRWKIPPHAEPVTTNQLIPLDKAANLRNQRTLLEYCEAN
jgi:hypothetical protein